VRGTAGVQSSRAIEAPATKAPSPAAEVPKSREPTPTRADPEV
jgi:hypothetical protein